MVHNNYGDILGRMAFQMGDECLSLLCNVIKSGLGSWLRCMAFKLFLLGSRRLAYFETQFAGGGWATPGYY